MIMVKPAAHAFTHLVSPLPIYAQPGLLLAVGLLLLWLLVKRGRVFWCWLVRSGAGLAATSTALVLYPEYVHTQAQRRQGRDPSGLALAVTPFADRLLDLSGGLRESHPRPPTNQLGRVPWRSMLVLWAIPVVVYAVARKSDGADLLPLNTAIFGHWASFQTWSGTVSSAAG
jgi:hypothetical protein